MTNKLEELSIADLKTLKDWLSDKVYNFSDVSKETTDYWDNAYLQVKQEINKRVITLFPKL